MSVIVGLLDTETLKHTAQHQTTSTEREDLVKFKNEVNKFVTMVDASHKRDELNTLREDSPGEDWSEDWQDDLQIIIDRNKFNAAMGIRTTRFHQSVGEVPDDTAGSDQGPLLEPHTPLTGHRAIRSHRKWRSSGR